MSSNASPCPFCSPAPGALIAESDLSRALRDGYPVAPGHTLVVPKRHVARTFDLTDEEWADLWALARRVREMVPELLAADALNIGVNDGAAAGQTVPHVHVHLIPRRHGDTPDPRGGVRRVIPHRADYWSRRE
ncbi:MAG TPA: HIT family protein [Longimicrobiales bacterium]|nr:HIT family protein [Longimicrobiales bacterium]